MFGERHALAALRRQPRQRGRILCYHAVGQPEFGVNDVPPVRFRRQIELALELGYRFVAPAEIAATGGEPKQLAVSFDDALKSVRTKADPILPLGVDLRQCSGSRTFASRSAKFRNVPEDDIAASSRRLRLRLIARCLPSR
jgi:hypothetical protein